MSKNFKMIGSHGTLEGLLTLLKRNWSWSTPSAICIDKDLWSVQVNGKDIQGLRIIKKSGRYRLEMEVRQ